MRLQAHAAARYDGHVHPFRAASEGVLAGLLAALLVAGVHACADVVAGDPLRTPALLSTLLLEGQDGAGIQGILLFSVLHLSLWIAAGVASAYAIAVADAHPRTLRLVFAFLLFGWISVLYLSGALSQEAMVSLRLWLGTLLGAAAVVGTLVVRHPRLLTQPERNLLTDASRMHLLQAFRFESESLAATRVALRRFDARVLADLVERKAETIAEISAMLERLEIEQPNDARLPVAPETFEAALREAIARERDAVERYDAFLASSDERSLRQLLLDHRFRAFDENLPRLEAALHELEPAGSDVLARDTTC